MGMPLWMSMLVSLTMAVRVRRKHLIRFLAPDENQGAKVRGP
jgi:hypothetical protein